MAAEPERATPAARGVLRGAAVLGLALAVAAAAAAWRPERAAHVELLPAGDPWVRLEREIQAEFGVPHPVVWLLEAEPGGTIWTRPALERLRRVTRAALEIPGVQATQVMSIASPNVRELRVGSTTLVPRYVMDRVPETEAAIAELRRRVEGNPNLAGTLVATDGRAALVVAAFTDSADPAMVARRALEVARAARGGGVHVYVIGEAVLARQARDALVLPAAATAGALLLGLALVGAAAGLRLLASILVATAAAFAGSLGLLVAAGHWVAWPWTAGALPIVAAAATAAVAVAARPGGRRPALALAEAVGLGGAALAAVASWPVGALGAAVALGAPLAAVAAVGLPAPAPARERNRRIASLRVPGAALAALLLVCLLGIGRLRTDLDQAGFARHYVPGPAAAALGALDRAMPPPTELAIRLRGPAGFVSDPAVLGAIDAVAAAVAPDPATIRTQSIAELLRLVHRAFSGDPRADLPSDRGLLSRYLALAYSPGFHRFVDRGFHRTAVWIQLSSDRPADVRRVADRAREALSAAALPAGVTVETFGGSGALVLVTARLVGRLLAGAAVLVVATACALLALAGARAATLALAGGATAALFATGGLGLVGLPLDPLTAVLIVVAAAAGSALGAGLALGGGALATLGRAAATAAALAAVLPFALLRALAVAALGPAAVAIARFPPGRSEARWPEPEESDRKPGRWQSGPSPASSSPQESAAAGARRSKEPAGG